MGAMKLQLKKRSETGKNEASKMRHDGMIPGVIYSKGEETKHIKVDTHNFEKIYRTAGTSTLIDVELGEEIVPALIKEVQKHPFKNQYFHVDLQKLNMKEKVKLTAPITLVGQQSADLQHYVLMQQLDELEIECLPRYIPDKIEVDISEINPNSPIHVSDLDIFEDENVTVLTEPEKLVANLVTSSEEEEDEEEVEDTMYQAPMEVQVVGEEEEE